MRSGRDGIRRLATFTTSGSLPEFLQDIIFSMLLESPDPISSDTISLVAFVESKVGLPYSTFSGKGKRKRPKCLLKPAHEMRAEGDRLKADLETIPPAEWLSEPGVS